MGLLNCSTAGKCPAIAQSIYTFLGDFCTEFFLPRREPEAQSTEVIKSFAFFFFL